MFFFCDLYVSTNGTTVSGAKEARAAGMPESQLLDDGSDDDNEGGTSSLGIVSGYSAVLLGFLCLRRQAAGCASRVRSRLAAIDATGASGLSTAAAREAARTGRPFLTLEKMSNFSGSYVQDIDLAQGRFALVTGREGFALVKTNQRRTLWRGREVSLSWSGTRLDWRSIRSRQI